MSQANNRPYAPQRRPAPRPAPHGAPRPAQHGPRPGVSRPAAGRTQRALPYGLGMLLIICLVIALAGAGLQLIWPEGFPLVQSRANGVEAVSTITEIHSSGPIRINEIMSTNRNTLSIADGSSPDWIEIANVSGNSVNLSGYQLAKGSNSASVFVFPEIWLEPDGCILVYADSRLRNTAGEDLHAPFRISSAGDTLMLFNSADTAVDTLNIPVIGRDCSYIRTGTSTWEESALPTPGMANTQENYFILNEPAADSPVIVNEIMSTNKSAIADENGQYYDYIEIYNRSSESVNLSGWYLSDDSISTRKWRFPDMSIEPGQYIVIFASKLDRSDDPAHLHTNFGLSSEGEYAVLSDANGRVMDSVEFGLLKANVAYLRQADGSWSQGSGTPGRAN